MFKAFATRVLQTVVLATCLAAMSNAAGAHPHVFIETSAQLVFDASGKLTAIVNTWLFDEFYSSFVTLGMNVPGKTASQAQLQPIADTNIAQMKQYHWFNFAKTSEVELKFATPTEYVLQQTSDLRLMFQFTLPLSAPAEIGGGLDFQIFDPSRYVAFEADAAHPLGLRNEPSGCTFAVRRPAPLTAEESAQVLAAKKFDTVFSTDFSARLTSQVVVACAAGGAQ